MLEARSYREILRSTALIGGASAATVCIGIARTKAMALILGPAGFGLMGVYLTIVDLTRSVAQLGINASGVRQIADASASDDRLRLARTITALRRVSLLCALLGAALLAALAVPVAVLTFGDAQHAAAIAGLGAAVFFGSLAAAQGALLQGLRRVGDLARVAVAGGVIGSAAAVALVLVFGSEGMVPALAALAAGAAAASWWYARRVRVDDVGPIGTAALTTEIAALARLGLAFLASGLLTALAAYAVRGIVLRHAGLEAAGLYQAAWTLGGFYIGFVLQALGTDFYPRLVGAKADDALCTRLVNEQAHVSLLIALPGVLATLTLAPVALEWLYSAAFAPAVPVLRWIVLGMALRVLTWPLGYIVIAHDRQRLFMGIEAAWATASIGLAWIFVEAFGVVGSGIAFFACCALHAALVWPIARYLIGFRWSRANRFSALAAFALVGAVFVGDETLPAALAAAFGGVATVASIGFAVRRLVGLAEPQNLPRPLARLLQTLG
jgi:PST family polysaccharide transporter